MKIRKVPMRTCIVTKEKLEKINLIRIVRTPEGEVKVDLSGKMNGRGAYLKKDIEAVNKAKKTKVLDRHLETNVPDSLYDELIEVINEE
ncbi:MAG TPA: YlxR family protein [Bacilli bacterium]|nr:YlxR family protein [Bacilli bacterium]